MKVSVCMATYNGEKFIKEQIDSIFKQINIEDELIISDDSSSDNTISIIQSIKDNRIKLLLNNKYKDPIKNFQNALIHAKGDIIFLSDQDDVWLDGKYNKMCMLLDEYDLIVSDSIVTDENLKMIHPSFFEFFGSKKGIFKNVIRSAYYGCCMAFRKKVLEHSLPFPDTKEIGHDLWLGLVAEMIGKVYYYPEPLIYYRRHINASTPTGLGKSKRNIFQMANGRLIMIKEVLKFYIKYLISKR